MATKKNEQILTVRNVRLVYTNGLENVGAREGYANSAGRENAVDWKMWGRPSDQRNFSTFPDPKGTHG